MARDYDHLFKLLIIGDSGELLLIYYFFKNQHAIEWARRFAIITADKKMKILINANLIRSFRVRL